MRRSAQRPGPDSSPDPSDPLDRFGEAPARATGFYVETVAATSGVALAPLVAYCRERDWRVEPTLAERVAGWDITLPEGASLDPGEAFSHVGALRRLEGVTYAEPVFEYRMDRVAGAKTPEESFRATYILGMDRPHLPTDWHLALLDIPHAREKLGLTGEGVVVAHPDTGYTRHPEVIARIEPSLGRDFLRNDSDPVDDMWTTRLVNVFNPGHGTGTGSLIVSPQGKQAATPGEKGVEGVAPGATLMPLRVTPMVAMTSTRNLADAIGYAADRGARVVSVSLGAPFPDRRTERVLEAVKARGVIVCVAAGNVVRFVTYPGSSPNVLTVAGCTYEREAWLDSCRGPAVDVTAGAASVWVAVTQKRGDALVYSVGQGGGTSFAVATIAGLAALWLAHHGVDNLDAAYGRENVVEVFHRLIRKSCDARGQSYFASGNWGAGIPDASALFDLGLPTLDALRGVGGNLRLNLAPAKREALAHPVAILRDLGAGALPTTPSSIAMRDSGTDPGTEPHRLALARLIGTGAPAKSASASGLALQEDLEREVAFHLSVRPDLRSLYVRAVAEADGGSLRRLRTELTKISSPDLTARLAANGKEATASRRRGPSKPSAANSVSVGSEAEPATRRLRVYAFDPSLATRTQTRSVSEVTLRIPWEPELGAGPVGEYVEVVDVDPASGCAYPPVDLNQLGILAQDGLTPSEGNPQFHQQMVYAVAMHTIQNFESALGRKVLWRARQIRENGRYGKDEYIQRLRIYPHALREANAYYSPDRRAILMGYFPASAHRSAEHYPGGLVFTCLSQDIVAHEVTHAILDGLHPRFAEATNVDVLAFHEAFADVVALLQRFSQTEVLRHQIAQTRGDLRSAQNLLGQLAQQFGRAVGGHGALRQYVGVEADPTALDGVDEPHKRGAVLVAAIFDAFLTIYQSRTADLLRLATGGSGVLGQGAIHPDLVNRLAREAAKSARHVLSICIRALNYCPPVDITFGEYLRALVTADYEQMQEDEQGYRVAFIEAFRKRGIYPPDVRTLSEESLLWKTFEDYAGVHPDIGAARELLKRAVERSEAGWSRDSKGGAGLLTRISQALSSRESVFESSKKAAALLHRALVPPDAPHRNAGALRALGLDVDEESAPEQTRETDAAKHSGPRLRGKIEVHSVRSMRRILPNGEIRSDIVIEITQWRRAPLDAMVPIEQKHLDDTSFLVRGGITIIYNRDTATIRYVIRKNLHSVEREARQRPFVGRTLALAESPDALKALRGLYLPRESGPQKEPFAIVHRGGA